jgi:hypothetical protein
MNRFIMISNFTLLKNCNKFDIGFFMCLILKLLELLENLYSIGVTFFL